MARPQTLRMMRVVNTAIKAPMPVVSRQITKNAEARSSAAGNFISPPEKLGLAGPQVRWAGERGTARRRQHCPGPRTQRGTRGWLPEKRERRWLSQVRV